METAKLYPISEIFTSPQGEGQFAGCMMTFIRLAGCSVGKPFPKEYYKEPNCSCSNYHQHSPTCAISEWRRNKQLPIYTEKCTLYDGRTFACDTDYRVKQRISVEQIFSEVPANIEHICITGGEPFVHSLNELVEKAAKKNKQVHIETSGTRPLEDAFPSKDFIASEFSDKVWITVSPKLGILDEMILRADEIKLLVDEDFNPSKIPEKVISHKLVYIQPVNEEFKVNKENLKRTMEWQKKYPHWRVSIQLHKTLEEFSGERVR